MARAINEVFPNLSPEDRDSGLLIDLLPQVLGTLGEDHLTAGANFRFEQMTCVCCPVRLAHSHVRMDLGLTVFLAMSPIKESSSTCSSSATAVSCFLVYQ